MFRVLSFACLLTVVACVSPASAAVAIHLDDTSGNSVTVFDGSALDSNPTLGAVTYVGGVGAGVWTVNVTTGVGTPLLGTSMFPHIDLNSVNVSSTGPGTLNLAVTQTGNPQTASPIGFLMEVGGTAAGTFLGTGYADATDTAFGTAVQIGSAIAGGPGAFSGSTSGAALAATTGAGMYSLTMAGTIVHTAAGQASSFNAGLMAVPEPASIVTWGLLGIMSLGLVWVKRRQ